ncbi:MAG: DUF3153 domain-containing protein [Betaproteobacteria bacterium]|nr:DUF3153 domain-containing protein [Betaproteobacteria bacterium]
MTTSTTDRPTLLLVDDESTNLAILREILKDHYRLLFAKDGMQAFDIAKQHAPDLILCDVMMPNVGGFDTCRMLKQEPRTVDIPVIFVTALTDAVNETQGFEVGAVDYVTKPVSPPVLFARVRTHLQLVNVEQLQQANAKLNDANAKLADANRRLRGNFEASIRMMSSIIEQRNGRLAGYCRRTAMVGMKVASALGMSDAEQEEVYHAGLLHEIGKIGFPDDLLDKPQPSMTQDELKLYKQHPLNAELILVPIEELATASVYIRHQHERVDGLGFPDGLVGDAIPLGASILAATKFYLDKVMGRRIGEQVRRRRRRQPPPPPPPAVGPTRAPLGFALLVGVLMLLALLLGGCGAIDAGVQFGAAGRVQLQLGLQHEGLAAQSWQEELARDLRAHGWSARHSGLHWTLRSPVLPTQQALDELSRTIQRATDLAGLDLPPPRLQVHSRNWMVGIRERISLELDLRRLPAWVPDGLALRLEPLAPRAVRSASPQPLSTDTGLLWTLEAGAPNQLVLALWRWSALGLGSLAIAALLMLSLVLQWLRRQLGYGWPQLPR